MSAYERSAAAEGLVPREPLPDSVFFVAYEDDETGGYVYLKCFWTGGQAQAWIDSGAAKAWYHDQHPEHANDLDAEDAEYPDQETWLGFFLVIPQKVEADA